MIYFCQSGSGDRLDLRYEMRNQPGMRYRGTMFSEDHYDHRASESNIWVSEDLIGVSGNRRDANKVIRGIERMLQNKFTEVKR